MNLLSIGEILWDFIKGELHVGGAPFNLCVQAKKLGHNVAFVSAVGDDDAGRGLLAAVERRGVSTEYIAVVPDAPTGTALVYDNPVPGDNKFKIYRPAAYDRIPQPNIRFDPDWICYGTLLQMTPAMRCLVRNLIAAHPRAGRFYDVNLRAGQFDWGTVAELLQSATVVKVNDEEAEQLEKELPHYRLERGCITRGAAGCTVILDGKRVDCPGYKVDVKDTVGAGDAFSAAFLHGLNQEWSAEQIGDFANRVGADAASRSGA